MTKFLVLYCSRYGQTRKIAEAMQVEFQRLGKVVDVMEAAVRPNRRDLGTYDAVVIGAPVYKSHFPRYLEGWLMKESETLNGIPSAFFSVCLGILERENAQAQEAERRIVEDMFTRTGWKPNKWRIFAGALNYRKYNWLVRFVMKKIAKKAGGDTDTSRDYEYTDFDDVRRFAHEFSNSVS
jgi:menaquinone-dependent protoporphyrinogen oxidase